MPCLHSTEAHFSDSIFPYRLLLTVISHRQVVYDKVFTSKSVKGSRGAASTQACLISLLGLCVLPSSPCRWHAIPSSPSTTPSAGLFLAFTSWLHPNILSPSPLMPSPAQFGPLPCPSLCFQLLAQLEAGCPWEILIFLICQAAIRCRMPSPGLVF